MKAVFWISLAGTFYTYIGYPVLIWMLSKLRPRRVRVAPITPSVSIVMAVHNGAALIHKQIDHLVGLDYSNIREIIIVSDGSSDGTVELLREEHHPLVHSIILEEHSGKAVAVNAGVANATGEIILFVDIRPQIGQGAIKQMMSNFADPTVGCVAGELSLRQDGHDGATANRRITRR
jgi:glycosyltransferase involved in cell wall biosynthesis